MPKSKNKTRWGAKKKTLRKANIRKLQDSEGLFNGKYQDSNKKTAKRITERNKILKARGKGLQSQKKISDVWFQNLWEESGMFIKEGPYRDRFNEPFAPYIPDCVNFFYKYVIECDDPTHEKPERKAKDQKKDEFFTSSGYKIFRVKSHNYEEFKEIKALVHQLRLDKQPTM